VRKFLSICVFFLFLTQQSSAQPEFFARIRALKNEGQHEKALTLVNEQIERIKEKDEVRLLQFERGLLLVDRERYDEAILQFQELIKTKHNITEYAHYYLATTYLKKGDLVEAQKHLQQVLALSPNIKMQNDVHFLLAKVHIENKKFKDARFLLQKLEKKNRREESYSDIIYELSRAERGAANYAQFCRWTKKLFANYPEYSKIQSWGLNHPANLFEEKPTQCPVSVEEKRTRIKNLQWADLGKKAKEEIDFLKKTKEAPPEEIEKLEIGYLLHEGEIKEVMDLLKPQYQVRKSDPNFLMMIASASAKLGENQAAVGSYYQAYKLSPRGKFGKQALYQAAFMSYQIQDYDGAARKFQEFMKSFAGSGLTRDARWHLAWIRYLRGDYDGSFKAFMDLKNSVGKSRRAAKSFPLDRLNYWIGMSLYRLGRYNDSRVLFENLSNDKLLGYYSILSKERLKKIDEYLPKQPKRLLPDESMKLSRFSLMDALMPADDPAWFREIAQAKLIETEGTEAPQSLDNPVAKEDAESEQELLSEAETRDRGIETADSEPEVEKITSIANPVLVKRFERARELMILGLNDWAKWDLYDIERKTSNKDYLKTLMQEYEYVENYHRSSYIGQINFEAQRGYYGLEGVRYLWEYTYPKAYSAYVQKYAKEFSIPTELVWGIMRAESHYKRDVISPVGALGLMQVMPVTASKISGFLGEKDFQTKLLLTPDPAIKIGSKYLQRLMKKFEGNIALVAASYNAGPHRVKSWTARFGQLDLDEFIEHIPYLETRNYVKKVMTNFNVYSRLYNGKKEHMLSTADSLKVRFTDAVHMKETWEDI